jgi:acyl dehydratase
MRYYEDFQPGTVLPLGSYLVTDEEIQRFGLAYDPQPFHLDHAAGREYHFGGLVASGWHTAAIFQRLYVDAVLSDAAVEGSPGAGDLRWPRPVRPGDVLTGRITVLDRGPSLGLPGCGLVRQRCELTDPAGQLVFQVTLSVVFRHRPAGDDAGTTAVLEGAAR